MTRRDRRFDISPVQLAMLLAEDRAADRAAWPLGYLCRNCDERAIDHPVAGPPVTCEEWR
jgi:hypothetical protein